MRPGLTFLPFLENLNRNQDISCSEDLINCVGWRSAEIDSGKDTSVNGIAASLKGHDHHKNSRTDPRWVIRVLDVEWAYTVQRPDCILCLSVVYSAMVKNEMSPSPPFNTRMLLSTWHRLSCYLAIRCGTAPKSPQARAYTVKLDKNCYSNSFNRDLLCYANYLAFSLHYTVTV